MSLFYPYPLIISRYKPWMQVLFIFLLIISCCENNLPTCDEAENGNLSVTDDVRIAYCCKFVRFWLFIYRATP